MARTLKELIRIRSGLTFLLGIMGGGIVVFFVWFTLRSQLLGALESTHSAGILLGLFVVALATAYLLTRVQKKICLDPLYEFSTLLRRVSDGDENAKKGLRAFASRSGHAAEWGFLAGEFLKTWDLMELRDQNLESLVTKRTAELERERAVSTEQAKMAAIGVMAGGIAHEVNNPLAMILSTVELMKEDVESGVMDAVHISRDCEKILNTVERIAKIVAGLRNYARDGSRDPFELTPLKKILADTVDLCRHRFRALSISLEVDEVPPDWEATCRPIQIGQILVNLLNNAVDAVSGSEDPWVQVKVADLGTDVEIRVIDSGAGIPPEVAAKIHEPFFTTKPVGQGTGLGLSVSQVIAAEHGGRLYLDGDSPRTCFVLRWPKKIEGSL